MINVLIFPCGSEIGLEIYNSLKFDKNISLFGLSSVESYGQVVFENYIEGISTIADEKFIDELNAVIEEKKIDIIFPAYDDVILYFSENRKKINCQLVIPNKDTCKISRSKRETYNFFKEYSFIPKLYNYSDMKKAKYPLFAKPDIGQGSQGIKKIYSYEDFLDLKKNDYVISEYLPGREYTVDCFTDHQRRLIFVSTRERKRIKNGISVSTEIIETTQEIEKIAEQINQKLEFLGVWFFQLKEDSNGHLKLLEIAPRVAGSMSLSRIRGFNLALNSVYLFMGHDIKCIPNLIDSIREERALSQDFILNLSYKVVYLDLDDTLILKNKINVLMIAFIYQCINKKIQVILLTKHKNDIEQTLNEYHISKKIFSKIIKIKETEDKSDYITEEDSIFIDDSFKERFYVSKNKKIPVFDLDAVTGLLEKRF